MIDGWLLLKYVDRAGGTEADDVGEPRLRAFYLTRAGFPAQVPDDLDDVGDTGRAEWVALGKQSAAGVDGNLPADIRTPAAATAPGGQHMCSVFGQAIGRAFSTSSSGVSIWYWA